MLGAVYDFGCVLHGGQGCVSTIGGLFKARVQDRALSEKRIISHVELRTFIARRMIMEPLHMGVPNDPGLPGP